MGEPDTLQGPRQVGPGSPTWNINQGDDAIILSTWLLVRGWMDRERPEVGEQRGNYSHGAGRRGRWPELG